MTGHAEYLAASPMTPAKAQALLASQGLMSNTAIAPGDWLRITACHLPKAGYLESRLSMRLA